MTEETKEDAVFPAQALTDEERQEQERASRKAWKKARLLRRPGSILRRYERSLSG